MTGRSPYPRAFATPEGRMVSISTMARALRAIRQDPAADYRGWDWFPVRGDWIIAEFRRGMHDRINLRAARAKEA